MSTPEAMSPEKRELIERYRRMTPTEKLMEVESLNRAEKERQREEIRGIYGDVPEDEMRMRLGARGLGRDLMVKAFGWDPDVKEW